MTGVECAQNVPLQVASFIVSKPGFALRPQPLWESTRAGAAGWCTGAAATREPSERMCIFIKIPNASQLSFKELTSVKNKKCNGEVSGKAWGD